MYRNIGGAELICGQSQEILSKLANDSVNLIITSPPYKDRDGYTPNLIYAVFLECYRVQAPNSLLFFNFGHLKEDKGRPFKALRILEHIGYKLYDTIVWVKPQYTPLQGDNLDNKYEFVFMLTKGDCPPLNKMSIGEPYQDKSNVNRYGKGRDLKSPSNIWVVGYETIQNKGEKLHPDRFPVELPTRCIKLANLAPRSLILDPFCGSATTGVAALNLGHHFIGIELDEKRWEIAEKRLLTIGGETV